MKNDNTMNPNRDQNQKQPGQNPQNPNWDKDKKNPDDKSASHKGSSNC